jgi:hypothetical protein
VHGRTGDMGNEESVPASNGNRQSGTAGGAYIGPGTGYTRLYRYKQDGEGEYCER